MITYDGWVSLVEWYEADPKNRQVIFKLDGISKQEAYVFENNHCVGQFVTHADQINIIGVKKEKILQQLAEIQRMFPPEKFLEELNRPVSIARKGEDENV